MVGDVLIWCPFLLFEPPIIFIYTDVYEINTHNPAKHTLAITITI